MELDNKKECVWIYPKLSIQYFWGFAQVGSVFSKVYFLYLLISNLSDPAGAASRKAKILLEKFFF